MHKDSLTIGICLFWSSSSLGSMLSILLVNFSPSLSVSFILGSCSSLILSLVALVICHLYHQKNDLDTNYTECQGTNEDCTSSSTECQRTNRDGTSSINEYKFKMVLAMFGILATSILFNLPYFWTTFFAKNFYNFSFTESGYLGITYELGFASCSFIVISVDKLNVFKRINELIKALVFSIAMTCVLILMLIQHDLIAFLSIFFFGVFNGCVDTYFTSTFVTNFSKQFKNSFFIASIIYTAGSLGFIIEGPIMSSMILYLGSISYIYISMVCGVIVCFVSVILLLL